MQDPGPVSSHWFGKRAGSRSPLWSAVSIAGHRGYISIAGGIYRIFTHIKAMQKWNFSMFPRFSGIWFMKFFFIVRIFCWKTAGTYWNSIPEWFRKFPEQNGWLCPWGHFWTFHLLQCYLEANSYFLYLKIKGTKIFNGIFKKLVQTIFLTICNYCMCQIIFNRIPA